MNAVQQPWSTPWGQLSHFCHLPCAATAQAHGGYRGCIQSVCNWDPDNLVLCCAATLEYSPGSAVAIFVTYLQPQLLKRMDETEGAYNLCELTEVQLQIALGLQDYK